MLSSSLDMSGETSMSTEKCAYLLTYSSEIINWTIWCNLISCSFTMLIFGERKRREKREERERERTRRSLNPTTNECQKSIEIRAHSTTSRRRMIYEHRHQFYPLHSDYHRSAADDERNHCGDLDSLSDHLVTSGFGHCSHSHSLSNTFIGLVDDQLLSSSASNCGKASLCSCFDHRKVNRCFHSRERTRRSNNGISWGRNHFSSLSWRSRRLKLSSVGVIVNPLWSNPAGE